MVETDWRYPLQVRHLTYQPDEYDLYRYWEPLTEAQQMVMDAFIRDHLNTPYDLLQTLSNELHILTGLPILDSVEWMNCSEMVDKMFIAAGIDLYPALLGKVTPADLARSEKLLKIA